MEEGQVRDIARDRVATMLGLMALAAALGGGCSRERPQAFDDEYIESLAELPQAKQSSDADLLAAIARVEEQRGAPWQLAEPPVAIAQQDNAADVIADLFFPAVLEELTEDLAGLYPRDEFQVNKLVLERMIRLRQRFDSELRQLEEALARPASRFPIEYRRGFFAETRFVDSAIACARLEAIRVAELLDADRPSDAVVPLRAMFRVAELLAAEKHVEARLAAADIRAEALRVLERIAQHEATTRSELIALLDIVEWQLAHWPGDALAWQGDRAMTLHAYEVIRDQRVHLLLTPDEVEEFRAEGILRDFPAAAKRVVDEDELYYLQAMDRLLGSCERPYHKRLETFAALRRELHELRDKDDFPLAAARLFLPAIEEGMRRQAEDRGRCEAAAIALSLAAGIEPPDYTLHPVTGKPYEITREGPIAVWAGDHQIVIPYPSAPVSTSTR
jgi:hypothetical protein